nr:hypothetical protein T27C5.3 - Caenorhabditis elegans [Caenorhabditis elegans]
MNSKSVGRRKAMNSENVGRCKTTSYCTTLCKYQAYDFTRNCGPANRDDCKYSWSQEFWLFAFSTTPVCLTISWYADFVKFNAIVILIAMIDVVTVSKVRTYKAKVFNGSSQSAKKTHFEMSFLKQACLQAFVFTCELVTYFLITPRIDPTEKWIRFILSTVAWALVHTIDGIITLSFNKGFSQTIF